MKSITNYIDELKEKTGSDYKSALILGVEGAAISMYRKRGQVGDETAIKIAEALGKREEELLISAAMSRSKGKAREIWEKIGNAYYVKLLMQLILYTIL